MKMLGYWDRCDSRSVLRALVVAAACAASLGAQDGGTKEFRLSPSHRPSGSQFEITVSDPAPTCNASGTQLDGAVLTAPRGSGLTVSDNAVKNGCLLTAMISIAPDALLDDNIVLRVEQPQSDGSSMTLGTAMFGIIVQPPGPIPPGLKPKVDAMWKVLPNQVTGDSFGRRIAKHYYGINVHIGNNAGYDLQLSTIGFEFNLGSGTKETRVPSDGYRDVRSTLEKEQQIGVRHWVLNSIRTAGLVMTGFIPFFDMATPGKQDYTNFVNVINGPIVEGFSVLVPDLTVHQLRRLDNQTLRDGLIVPNNTQFYTKVFFSKDFLGLSLPDRDNPRKVMEALGNLIIVGKKIQYLERVRVVATPEGGPVTPPPTVTGINPTTFTSGAANVATVITGSFLLDVNVTAPPGFSVSEIRREEHGNGLAFSLSVGELDPGMYSLLLTTPGGSAPLTIQVVRPSVITIEEDAGTAQAGVELEGGQLTASGGQEPYQWSLQDGQAPPEGLQLEQGGALTGTPTTAGAHSFGVRVTDATSASAQATVQLTVNLTISTEQLPSGTVGTVYGPVQLEATGGTVANYVWAVEGLPDGLNANQQGEISGTPAAATTEPVTVSVSVTDSDTNATGTRDYTLTIAAAGQ